MSSKATPTIASTPVSFKSSPSISSLTSTLPHTDSFVIIEASLTSVKYAIYHAIGHCTRHGIGHYDATATSYLRAVTAGFVGGAIFTIPYLFLLGWNDSLNSPDTEVDPDLSHDCLWHFGAELLYSAIAGGVGAVVAGDGRVDEILTGMLDGLCGPMILYSFLYLLLKGALWVIAHS